MFLARREIGKQIRVYQVYTHNPADRGWIFKNINPDTGLISEAAARAGTLPGCAATGETRTAATMNLAAYEELVGNEVLR